MKKKLLVINELFNIPVNDVVAKKSAHFSRVLVITELVVGGTQCINIFLFSQDKYLTQYNQLSRLELLLLLLLITTNKTTTEYESNTKYMITYVLIAHVKVYIQNTIKYC